MARKASPSKRGISRRREIDPQTLGVNLFTADRTLVDAEVGKSGGTRSEVIRHIVHQWSIKKRLAPEVADTAQEPSLLSMQRKALAALEDMRKEMETIQRQLKSSGQTQTDLLELNETEFKRLFSLGSAQYNLSAQSFSGVWAALFFIQRFIVEPTLARDPQHQKDSKQAAAQQHLEARTEGMNLVEQMGDTFQSPAKLELVLIRPTSNE